MSILDIAVDEGLRWLVLVDAELVRLRIKALPLDVEVSGLTSSA